MKVLQLLIAFVLAKWIKVASALSFSPRSWMLSHLDLVNLSQLSSRSGDASWTHFLYGLVGVLAVAAVGISIGIYIQKSDKSDKTYDDGVDAEKNLAEQQAREVSFVSFETPSPTKVADDKKSVDLEKFVQLFAKRMVMAAGPKITKVNNVRNALQKSVVGLKKKTSLFLQDEFYAAMGRVLREANAEEAMLLLHPSESVGLSLPPASILIAGLLSPVVLSVSLVIHLSQVFIVLVPVAAMCFWAIYTDMGVLNSCAIPTISYWVYVQGALALVLLCCHLVTSINIVKGKASIQAKVETLEGRFVEALSDGELSMDEARELFLVLAILLEHCLVVEDNLRRSIWRMLIGCCTLLWILTVVWTFVLVLGWSFVPGMVSFHPSAAGVPGSHYCGAWATVLCARLACVVSLFFLLLNLASVAQFLSDQLVLAETYSATVLKKARKFDESMLGVPVVETFVRAFLLRGTADTLNAQLNQSQNSIGTLEKEQDEIAAKLDVISKRILHHKAQADALRAVAGHGDGQAEDLFMKDSMTDVTLSSFPVPSEALEQAQKLEQATKTELNELYKRIREAIDQLSQSGAVEEALAQAQQAAAEGLAQAQKSASAGIQQVQSMPSTGAAAAAAVAAAQQVQSMSSTGAAAAAAAAAAQQVQGVAGDVTQAASSRMSWLGK